MWFYLRNEYYPAVLEIWRNNQNRLHELLTLHFLTPETHWDFFHTHNDRETHIRNYTPPSIQDPIVNDVMKCMGELSTQPLNSDSIGLILAHTATRQTIDMPESVVSWFDDTVRCLKAYDMELAKEFII